MSGDRRNLVWLGVVAVLMVANVDWWWWAVDTRVAGWLPAWVLWTMGLQFVLAFALYRLGKGDDHE